MRLSLIKPKENDALVGNEQQLKHDDHHRGGINWDRFKYPTECSKQKYGDNALLNDGHTFEWKR